MNVRFVVIAPKSHACTREVQLPILVGRADDAKFRIRDDRISRRHCEFTAKNGVVLLRDLGSTNGTFLNDEKLENDAPVEVVPDAVVRVGSCQFRVEYDSPAAQTAIAKGEDTVAEEAQGAAEAQEAEAEEVVAEEAVAEEAVDAEPVEEAVEAVEAEVVEEALEPEAEAPTTFAFGIATGKEPTVAAPAEEWLAAADEAEPAADPPDDEALGNFFKGLK